MILAIPKSPGMQTASACLDYNFYPYTLHSMKIMMNPALYLRPFVLAAIFVAAPLRADDTMAQPTQAVDTSHLLYLKAGNPDAIALLAPPPLPGSAEQAADMAEVQAVFHAAASNDMATAYSQKSFSAFNFTPDIGAFFQSNNLPKTTLFFKHVQTDATAVTDNAKDFYKRPRPYVTDPSLANGKLEKSFGYPSGHSTESMVLALVLADLFPDKHDAIIAEARSIGWHRVQIARHYPTDIYAGRVLAQAIVKELKQSDAFQHDFAEAKAEIAAAQTAAGN
jgi:acid phosphatase (class A)